MRGNRWTDLTSDVCPIMSLRGRQVFAVPASRHAPDFETGRPTAKTPSGISNRDDFGESVLRVLGDFKGTGGSEWENNTLERFLDGLSAFALARVHNQHGQEEPTWQLFAQIVAAATGYE